MGISESDVVPFSQVRSNLSELAEQVKAGESYVALIDARCLDYYHQLEREHIHLLLINEAGKGLDDIVAGRVKDAHETIKLLKGRLAHKPE